MGFLEFLKLNYIWILVVLILLIITIIGFFADRRDKKKKKDKNNLAKNDASLEVPNVVNVQGSNNENIVPEMNANTPVMAQNNVAMPLVNNNMVQDTVVPNVVNNQGINNENIVPEMNVNTQAVEQNNVVMPEVNNNMVQNTVVPNNIDNAVNLNNASMNMDTNVNSNNMVNNFEASYGTNISERPNLSTFSSVNITGNNVVQEPVNTITNVPVEPIVEPQEVNTNQVIGGFDMPTMAVNEEVNNNIGMPNENIVSYPEVPEVSQNMTYENNVGYNNFDMPIANQMQENVPVENYVEQPTDISMVNEVPTVSQEPVYNEVNNNIGMSYENVASYPEMPEAPQNVTNENNLAYNNFDMPMANQMQENVPVENTISFDMPTIENQVIKQDMPIVNEMPTVSQEPVYNDVNQIETPQETVSPAPKHPIFAGINFDKPASSPETIHAPEGENFNSNIQANEEINALKTDDDIWKL